jgi:hypothetical protein
LAIIQLGDRRPRRLGLDRLVHREAHQRVDLADEERLHAEADVDHVDALRSILLTASSAASPCDVALARFEPILAPLVSCCGSVMALVFGLISTIGVRW